jgi:hypothetical protein
MLIGIERMIQDLADLNYKNVEQRTGADNIAYAVIPDYKIPAGSFDGRVIDLGIPVPADYPRSSSRSIHVKADPVLFPLGSVPLVRNIVGSVLGAEWQYWSFEFILSPGNPTTDLMSKINAIFRKY